MITNRQLFLDHLGQTTTTPLSIEVVSAEGSFMYGPDGEKYLDLISGVSVSNVGHCNPRVIEAITIQAEKYLHLMVYGEIIQAPQVKYAALLASLLPAQLQSVYFVNSGSEAVDASLKLARRATGRPGIVSFKNSYHGSTYGALSVQGSSQFKEKFRPLLPGVKFATFNDPSAIDLIDEETACVIMEPVQGEAGVIAPDKEFLKDIRKKCNKAGVLLIFDEVQTAFGRTGHLFSFQKYDVIPDILILAKALGGGMPLGAFIASKELMSKLSRNPALGHITTFGGHPVSCAAGMAALEFILEEKLAEQALKKEALFRRYLKHRLITEIRGSGLLLAVRLASSKYVDYIISKGAGAGIVTDYFLFCGDAFRIAPPLTISEGEIALASEKIVKLLDKALQEAR